MSVQRIGQNYDDNCREENSKRDEQPVEQSRPTTRRLHFDPTSALAGTVQRRRGHSGRAAIVGEIDVRADDESEDVGNYQHVEYVLPAGRRYDASQQRTERCA